MRKKTQKPHFEKKDLHKKIGGKGGKMKGDDSKKSKIYWKETKDE